jgi:hypothetical protein
MALREEGRVTAPALSAIRAILLHAMAFALALLPLTASALGPDKACRQMGQNAEKTCVVSLSTLIARGEDFDGRIVLVTGFYAYADVPMLFASRDAYLASDAADGVGVQIPPPGPLADKLDSVNRRYTQVMGRYHATAGDVSAYGGFVTGGYIAELSAAGDVGDSPWGYSQPMPYDIRKKSAEKARAQASPAAPPQHCVSNHGAWCVLEGASEASLAAEPGFTASQLSNPWEAEAAMIVIAPASCSHLQADQLSVLSFEHAQHAYDHDWERLGVRLRADGKCDVKILLPEYSSNPMEWAFSSGLALLRTCRSTPCAGPLMSDLQPAFATRYRAAALPIIKPVASGDH